MSELVVRENPKSAIAESIRVIRTNIQYTLKLKKSKTILVTSTSKGEGKSFVSLNLAISFAQKNLKVLLVDSDLRLGRLHKVFNTSCDKGLSVLLCDNDGENYQKYIQKTGIKNVSFIPRGIVPPNPSELLDSNNVKTFISAVEPHFDIIIFDGTPITGLTDSLVFSKYIDKAVVVCAANITKTDMLEKTIKSLKNLEVDIAGIVLNRVTNTITSSYYGNYYSE